MVETSVSKLNIAKIIVVKISIALTYKNKVIYKNE